MHRTLRAAAAAVRPDDLDRGSAQRGVTKRALLTGVAAHDLYHAGQIQLLKRMAGRRLSVISSLQDEYQRYKALAEAAIAQVGDEELSSAQDGGNSIEMLVRHIAGNLASRFTDFRTSDGEKPWRRRDDEFESASLTRHELLQMWEAGWNVLFAEVDKLTDDDLAQTVMIRRQPLRIDEALHRSLAHTAYHVGQVVFMAKAMRGGAWRTLSIPRGKSEEYNRTLQSIQPPPTTTSSS